AGRPGGRPAPQPRRAIYCGQSLFMPHINRRRFLQAAGSAATLRAASTSVALVIDPADTVANAAPARWAAQELQSSLAARNVAVRQCKNVAEAAADDICIVATGPIDGGLPGSPESLAIGSVTIGGRAVLRASGRDSRGLTYALLDLADRVRHAPDAAA